MTNEMKVLVEFVREFSPAHQIDVENMTYSELFEVVQQVVDSHNEV